MKICSNCGAQANDYAAQCGVCGMMLQNPGYAAPPVPNYAQPMTEQRSVTSIGMWLLYMLLGPIGVIIILVASKDQSAKNCVLVDLILIGISLLVVGVIVAIVAALDAAL